MANLNIEKAILSSMAYNDQLCDHGVRVLDLEDFEDLFAMKIFEAMQKLRANNLAVDLIVLKECFPNEIAEVVNYTNEYGKDSSFNTYVDMMKEDRKFREAERDLSTMTAMVEERDPSVFDELGKVNDKLHSMGADDDIKLVGETTLVKDAIAELGTPSKGNTTGFAWLDRQTRGFQAGQMVVIGGRPSMGKSTLAMNIAIHMADKLNKTVAYFTLEDSKQTLMQRMISAWSLMPMRQFTSKSEKELKEAADVGCMADAVINNWKMVINDRGSMTAENISSNCYKIRAKLKELDLVVVDYIGMMQTHKTKSSSRQQELGEVSHALKRLARDLDCTVIVVAQLNREADKGTRPKLSDIRECGDIEQDADIVLFPWRNMNPAEDDDPYYAELILAKNRNGPTGVNKHMSWVGEKFRYMEVSNEKDS